MKRLNEALECNSYGAVAFNYDSPAPPEAIIQQAVKPEGNLYFFTPENSETSEYCNLG